MPFSIHHQTCVIRIMLPVLGAKAHFDVGSAKDFRPCTMAATELAQLIQLLLELIKTE